MKTINLGNTSFQTPSVGIGCMRIQSLEKSDITKFINTAMEMGLNFFDHADIYGAGECEELFSSAVGMNKSIREKMILQSKCGIRKGFFDFSKEYILASVDNILKRLQTEYLDILLLHRPDALVEPVEVAESFDILHNSGKVKYFGVSNHNSMQIELLKKYVKQPIVANQMQFSAAHTGMIDSGINVNMLNNPSINRDGSILDYCRVNDITLQAWSPFMYGYFEGIFINNEKFPELNTKIDEIAGKYGVSNTAVSLAWILRHPAKIQAIPGTMKLSRLKDLSDAMDIDLTREEWYEIYCSAGNVLP